MARRWLRGVRARLVATYLLAAALAALVGVVVFTIILARSLDASVDASLRTTANALTADIRAGDTAREGVPRVGDPGEHRHYLPGFAAVYNPAGRLVRAEPLVLLADPTSGIDAGRDTGTLDREYAGQRFRVHYSHVSTRAGRWLVIVGQNLEPTDDANSDATHALYFIVPVGVLLSGLGAWLLSGAALRPVERMRADAQRLSETNEAGNLTVPATSDSLNALARTFNTLLDRLHVSLERQRGLVADAGHELRTPLAVLTTELDTAVRPSRSRDDLIDSISHARHEVARLASLSDDLLLLAQADGPNRLIRTDLTDVGELLRSTVTAHRSRFTTAHIALGTGQDRAGVPLLADLDPVALRRILDNLLANSLRYTPAGGRVDIEARTHRTPDGPQLCISVDDTGPGFPPGFVEHAFERFARADPSRSRTSTSSGSGLGLAIVETLVAEHGGTVHAVNRELGGARVELSLPLTEFDADTDG